MLKNKKILFVVTLCLSLVSCGDCSDESKGSQIASLSDDKLNPEGIVVEPEETEEGPEVIEEKAEEIEIESEPLYGVDPRDPRQRDFSTNDEHPMETAKAASLPSFLAGAIVTGAGIFFSKLLCPPTKRAANNLKDLVARVFKRSETKEEILVPNDSLQGEGI
jgi:hypothetical protein